jgi:asparagine synthase (glutamine-hydrolysing)
MCGIFGLISHSTKNTYDTKIIHRGPDNTVTRNYNNCHFSFHRLCINDLSDSGNQPFENDKYIWMCNGEIYNYKKLISKYNLTCKSNSDCEVIGYLIDILGICSLAKALDGVFAIAIYDKTHNYIYLIRDTIGVRPLYYYNQLGIFAFSSEGKSLNNLPNNQTIQQLPPSSYLSYNIITNKIYINKYFLVKNIKINTQLTTTICFDNIQNLFVDSIKKRLISDRPIGCLLSGGLDSSLVASILSKLLKEKGKTLKTFSVGFSDSEDLKYAKKVAKYLGTDHYELILDYKQVIHRIPEVIKAIETYDITTIRASIGMYLLAEYINQNHPEKVIFSGEGSDEIFGGYLYFHKSPTFQDFEKESTRLVDNLFYFDVLRADRCTSTFGLELRVPFLDKEFVKFVMSIPGNLRKFTKLEKYILRQSFTKNYLPHEILMRKKEGFSDGVGGMLKPFYKHIQEYLRENLSEDYVKKVNSDDELEREYYKDTYYEIYKYSPIPYYWMPKWVNTKNPSGRVFF